MSRLGPKAYPQITIYLHPNLNLYFVYSPIPPLLLCNKDRDFKIHCASWKWTFSQIFKYSLNFWWGGNGHFYHVQRHLKHQVSWILEQNPSKWNLAGITFWFQSCILCQGSHSWASVMCSCYTHYSVQFQAPGYWDYMIYSFLILFVQKFKLWLLSKKSHVDFLSIILFLLSQILLTIWSPWSFFPTIFPLVSKPVCDKNAKWTWKNLKGTKVTVIPTPPRNKIRTSPAMAAGWSGLTLHPPFSG